MASTWGAPCGSHPRRWLFYFLGAALLSVLVACGQSREPLQLAGHTMGTSWHVTVAPNPAGGTGTPPPEILQAGIEAVLEAVNASMSTYRQDSEISRFNAAPADTWFDISPEFYTVLSAALAVGFQSEGAYDVTVAPLVNLWGFGPGGPTAAPPEDDAIAALREDVGQDHLRLDGEGQRLLKRRRVALDFSSIAKGFAVDRVARWLASQGLVNYLVEVGGEMRAGGVSHRGDPWRVAIERPDSGDRGVERAIRLSDVAVATSGDYRNFFELGGRRYSHSIDPRSGYPVSHDLVSVTVVHPSAMMADAWATALTVLGQEEGMAVAQSQGLAVYFIQRRAEGFHSTFTPAFGQFLESDGPVN